MSTINVNQMVDSQGGVLAPSSSVMRNRLINSDMRIDQRNAGAEVNPAVNGTYYIDRWYAGLSVAGKFKIGQNAGAVTPPAGFVNYLGCTSLSAYSVGASENFRIQQNIEGFNVADLNWGTANAKTVTLSFWVRSSLTGTFGGALRNSAVDRSYPFSYTISDANTWEQKSITITGDTTGTWLTNSGAGVAVSFSLGSGSTVSGTAGVWAGTNYTNATGATSVVGTNGATFYITGVQLEKGTQATSFEYRQYGQELALCQRYYEKSYNASAIAGAVTTNGMSISVSYSAVLNRPYWSIPYKVSKRTSATPVVYSPDTGASGKLSNGAGSDVTASIGTSDENSFSVYQSGTSVSGNGYSCQWIVSAEL